MIKPLPTDLVQYILNTFTADFTTGQIFRKVNTSSRKGGKAGTELPRSIGCNSNKIPRQDYRVKITFNKRHKILKVSRVIFILFYGRDVKPGYLLDHADGNSLNNAMFPKPNIRECTPAQNAQNSIKRRGSQCQYKGVNLIKSGKFQARIVIDGKQKCLGSFTDEIDAARAYDRAALSAFGTFAKTNFSATDYEDIVLPKQKACAFRGVVKSGKKFLSQFRHSGQRYYGGSFDNPADAFIVTNACRESLGLSPYPAP